MGEILTWFSINSFDRASTPHRVLRSPHPLIVPLVACPYVRGASVLYAAPPPGSDRRHTRAPDAFVPGRVSTTCCTCVPRAQNNDKHIFKATVVFTCPLRVEKACRRRRRRRVLLCVGRFRLARTRVSSFRIQAQYGARIADAKLNPITERARTLNNHKYAGQFITAERGVSRSLPCVCVCVLSPIEDIVFHTHTQLYFSLSLSRSSVCVCVLFLYSISLHSRILFIFIYFLNEPRTAPDVGYRYPRSHGASFRARARRVAASQPSRAR